MSNLIRILVASDLHGSNACFRKLIGLTRELRPDALVIAGDFSGKYTHPIMQHEGSWQALENGRWSGISSIDEQLRKWADVGQYWATVPSWTTIDPEDFHGAALQAKCTRARRWIEYADSELAQLGVPCFVIPGNDDSDEVAEALASGAWVKTLDERVERLNGFELAGLGYSNPTPWRTWRELAEGEILERLGRMTLEAPERAILVIHVPPYESGLDVAPALVRSPDGALEVVAGSYINVGSTAVSAFLAEVRPMLVISGHCHTSPGVRRLGRTACANPGSSYNMATLNALMLVIEGNNLVGFQFLVR